MELIILGLILIKKSTIYELKKAISANLSSMSSNSSGSIQAAVKKLLAEKMIVYTEFVENSVNKKVYEVTDSGRVHFFTNVSKPMLYKEKNMEHAKFFFMGFVPAAERIGLINAYIAELKKGKAEFERIRDSSPDSETVVACYMQYLEATDSEESFKAMLRISSAADGVKDIADFQFASLELAIAKADFEINWFEQFKARLEGDLI